jgi:hypothetical protein
MEKMEEVSGNLIYFEKMGMVRHMEMSDRLE